MGTKPGLAVIIPAKDESARIATTVAAARRIEGVSQVVVVDDGSSDDTGDQAQEAGASVVRHPWNKGKAAAMDAGSARLAALDKTLATTEGIEIPRVMLFLDADLGDSAENAGVLAEPVLADEADMTIAILPAQSAPGGGRGRVVRLARNGIKRETGWTATQPLSGSRCLTREAFAAARPLAAGWGVETGLTIDLLKAGFRVVEVPCELQHRVTGSDLAGQWHRAAQYRDVWLALLDRRIRKRNPRIVLGFAVATRMVRSLLPGRRRRH